MKHQTSEELGLSAKSAKTPWFLHFALTANGIVSFVQNLLPSLTQKEASTAAAVLVGIGLFCAPLEEAQAQSGIPEVTEFCIFSNAASDYGLSRGYTGCLPLLDLSGSSLEWILGSVPVDISGFYTEDNVSDSGGVYGHFCTFHLG